MSALTRVATLALGLVLVSASAGVAQQTPAAPPLTARIFFPAGAPANGVYGVDGSGAPVPIPLTLQIENTSGAPIATTDGYSATEFFRRLYFTDPQGGTITNKIEEQIHDYTRVFMCLSRAGRLLSAAVPVVPIEVLGPQTTPPTPRFFLEFRIADARAFYDLSRPGTYTVNARIPLLVFALTDPNAVLADCDQVPGQVANVGALAGHSDFTIVSNTLSFTVDAPPPLPPVTTATVSPTPASTSGGWLKDTATVSFTATSPSNLTIQRIVVQTSGAQPGDIALPGSRGSITVSAEGKTNVAFHAEDAGGNIEALDAGHVLSVQIDRTAPTIAVTTPAPNATYDLRQVVNAAYTCRDTLSNVASCAGPVANGAPIDTSSTGTKTFTVTARDNAGNVAAPVSVTYVVVATDVTPPTTTASRSPAANGAGWNRTNVTVTLSAADTANGSGVSTLTYSATGATTIPSTTVSSATAAVPISAEGTTTLTFSAKDAAGNAESAHSIAVRIDKTPPTISGMPAAGCSIWPPNGSMVKIATVTAADQPAAIASGLTGPALVTVTSNEPVAAGDIVVSGGVVQVRATRAGNGNGRVYTVTATAGDVAGNTTTVAGTCTVPHDQGKK